MALAEPDRARRIEAMEARVERLRSDPAYEDDLYGLIVVRQALRSIKEGSGGIGACLVDAHTGKVVARGRNRQYKPYFRSDLHAEMDLLTRYEDWLRKTGGPASKTDLRDCAGAKGRQVTDMVGRTVSVPAEARRIVTTFKPASLCVTALGLQDRLVGIDTDSRRDPLQLAVRPAIARLPAVGQKSTGLNFEAILSVEPDLVVLFAQKDGIAIADRLGDHGVAAIVILPEKMAALYDTLRLIAGAAGAPQQADRAITACRRVVALVDRRVRSIPDDRRRRVYFASPRGIFSTATGELLQDEMVTRAGAIHVGHVLSGYFREISPEQFIAWNPDIVLQSGHRHHGPQDPLREPQFAGVSAVAAGRIYRFPANIAHWDFPSPLSALGILWIAETCYPERFADVDLAAEIDRFHLALFGRRFAELGGKLAHR